MLFSDVTPLTLSASAKTRMMKTMLKSELWMKNGAFSKGRGGGCVSPSFAWRRSRTEVEDGDGEAAHRPLAAEAGARQRVTLLSVTP